MYALDPILLDRELAHAASTSLAWRRRLRVNPDHEDNPLSPLRRHLTQVRFEMVSALEDYDPLRVPLRRWIFRLAEERINHYWLTLWHLQRYAQLHYVEEPARAQHTVDELLKKTLTDERLREAWAKALLEHTQPSSETFTTLAQRRFEIGRRLGFESPDELELPASKALLSQAADDWLERTAPLAEEFRREEVSGWVGCALGHEAASGFPAALKEHSLAQWFRGTRLLEGLELNTDPLPNGVAASSYLRGLEILGRGLREAGSPQDLPFCVGHDPYQLESHSLGALFAGLLLSGPFLERNLQLNKKLCKDHLRTLARVVLLESRSRALKIKLRWESQQGSVALLSTFTELVHVHLGVRLAADSCGTLLRQEVDDPQRFCALLLGRAKFESLTETHDDDWFRNPRAIDQIRSDLKTPPATQVSEIELKDGADRLALQLCLLLQ
ncbi:MAG: hypothetical protein RJA70_3844 [Pseudomonadota bacterium]|jgi:hypothetical protein